MTALLSTLSKFLLTLYLVYSGVAFTYRAAGSLVLILLWVCYSAQILLFGAIFTRVDAEHFNCGVQPQPNGVLVSRSRSRQPQTSPGGKGVDRALRGSHFRAQKGATFRALRKRNREEEPVFAFPGGGAL